MDIKTTGTVTSVAKQWWFKVNTNPIRMGAFDGAIFPHIIKVSYTVNGKEYVKRKWIHAGRFVPSVGESVSVSYSEEKPSKAKINA